MNSVVLLVDDDASVLKGYQRNIGDMFATEVAHDGAEALQKIQAEDKYALILTDYRMPGMTGVELLRKAAEIRPDTVRMLITGYADVKITLEAINEGSVFRMLTKPCNVQSFYKAIEDGLRQHELITVEKSLLDQTLKGAVHMLGDIISVMDHGAFGRGHKMAIAAREIAKIVGIKDLWEVEVAATLAEIGRVTLPGAVSHKRLGITQNTEAETSLLTRLPEFSARLLSQIPRLETVSKAVLYQSKNYDGSGFPDDRLREDYIPMPARILHALNYLVLESEKERDLEIILDEMALYNKKFDRIVVEACKEILPLLQRILTKPLKEVAKKKALIKDLAEGQRLASNIETKDGIIIVNAGTILRPAVLQRIQNFATIMPIKEPIEIEQD